MSWCYTVADTTSTDPQAVANTTDRCDAGAWALGACQTEGTHAGVRAGRRAAAWWRPYALPDATRAIPGLGLVGGGVDLADVQERAHEAAHAFLLSYRIWAWDAGVVLSFSPRQWERAVEQFVAGYVPAYLAAVRRREESWGTLWRDAWACLRSYLP